MSLLRIYAPLGVPPQPCQWVFTRAHESTAGQGAIDELPRGADRVQLIVPASDVLITRVHLPKRAKTRTGAVLAFAVEEATAADPEENQVSWLGAVAPDADALAVVDKRALQRWREALAAIGIRTCEVHAETLLLPRTSSEWSLAWGGGESFVRYGEFEGAAMDCGDQASPPVALRMLVDEARLRGVPPEAIALYLTQAGGQPDLAGWHEALGIPLRVAGTWDWRSAPAPSGGGLTEEKRGRGMTRATLAGLRPAAWIAGAALALHAIALIADWAALASEQRRLRGQMEARFRSAFPDAVAVSDPVLQMRRQIAAARHRAGIADSGDFSPMVAKVGAGLKEMPPGLLRTLSFEEGRMTLELAAIDEAALRRVVVRLAQSGLKVEVTGARVITVRAL